MEEKIRNEWEKLEKENKQYILYDEDSLKYKIMWRMELVIKILIILCIPIYMLMLFIFPLFTIIGVILLVAHLTKHSKKTAQFEEKIIIPLIQKLDFVQKVEKKSGISSVKYGMAKFRDTECDSYSSNYYISGNLDNASIEMSKVRTYKEKEYRDNEGNLQTSYKMTFEGFLIVTTLKENIIDGYIHIFNDKDDSRILNLKENETKVNMDSMMFEKEFDVYSTDPIRALEILTSEIMQRLIEEKEKMCYKYDISITKNLMIMRIFGEYDIFSIDFKRNKKSKSYNETIKNNIINDMIFIQERADFMNELANNCIRKQY